MNIDLLYLMVGFNLMDYSLLVGVKRRMYMVNPPTALPNQNSRSRQNSTNASGSFTDFSVRTSSVAREGAPPLTMESILHHSSGYVPPPPPGPAQSPSSSQVRGSHAQRKTGGPVPSRPEPFSSFSSWKHSSGGEGRPPGTRYDAAAVEGAGAFYFGIIDILQEWDWRKWNERMLKVYILQKNGSGLSAMEPKGYQERFMQRAVFDVFSGVDGSVVQAAAQEEILNEAAEMDHYDAV